MVCRDVFRKEMKKKLLQLLFFIIGWTVSVYGCDYKKRDNSFWSLLYQELKKDVCDSNAIKSMIDSSTGDINDQDSAGNTVLYNCIWHKKVTIELVDFLLKRGARTDIKNKTGYSVISCHRYLSPSPFHTPKEGLVNAQSVPNREVMDFIFAYEVSLKLENVLRQRNLQEKQEMWSKVTVFR
jgi:hypothetical protein